MAKTTNKDKTKTKSTSAKKSTTKKATTAVKTKKANPKATKKVEKKTTSKKGTTVNNVKESKGKTSTRGRRTTTKSTTTTKSGRKVEVVTTTPKPVKKIKGYTKKELAGFKKVILDKRTEIIEQLQNLKDQMMDTTTGQYVNENSPYSLHMAEQGTDAQEREKLYLWAQRETKFLGYLEDALQRIENGSYGICIDSLELREGPHLIPKNRLLAVPHTQHCVDCKNKKNK